MAAVIMFVLARADATAPVGLAALGGAVTGAMTGNLVALRRARQRSA